MKKLGYVIRVTKQTQAKEGLNYTLEARRVSPEAVLVSMELPREGKLKDMSRVTMNIRPILPPSQSRPVSHSPLVYATLQTTETMVVLFVKTARGRFLRNFSPRFGDSMDSVSGVLVSLFSGLGIVDLSRRRVAQRLVGTALIVEG